MFLHFTLRKAQKKATKPLLIGLKRYHLMVAAWSWPSPLRPLRSIFPGYADVPCGLITKEAVTALKRSSCEESSGERSLAHRSTWKEIPGAKCFGLEALFSWLWVKHRSEAKRRVTSVLSIILCSLLYSVKTLVGGNYIPISDRYCQN